MTKNISLKIKQGGILKKPFYFIAPEVEKKTSGVIQIDFENAEGHEGHKMSDTFNVTVFPRKKVVGRYQTKSEMSKMPFRVKVGVVSINNEDTLTSKLGIQFRKVSLNLNGKIPSDLDLLVIERGTLTKSINASMLEDFINNGGNVLILEQTDQGLMDWRLRERRIGAVFIADDKHPILNGLDNKDLSYFRGESDIVPAEKRPSKYYRNGLCVSMETPRLTNEGSVATFVFQKPCYGNIHPILVCGYDLEEVTLIEMRSGKGRIVWCQVDVSNRYGLDPAATKLVDNIYEYLLSTCARQGAKPSTRGPKVVYVGDKKGRKFLSRLGISFSDVVPDKIQETDVLVVGNKAVVNAESLIKNIKTVIVLPFSDYLPAGLVSNSTNLTQPDHPYYKWGRSYYGFMPFKSRRPAPDRLIGSVPDVFRGIIDNDTYFFEGPKVRTFKVSPRHNGNIKIDWKSKHSTMIQVKIDNTSYILCSFDPYVMKYGECKRKAWRIWSVIFSNLNVKNRFRLNFKTPDLDISPGDWKFITDPDGTGIKKGYAEGKFDNIRSRKILTGKIWEEQGVNEINPNIPSPPDSAYDGFGWYFRKVIIPENVHNKKSKMPFRVIYFHIDGVRDVENFSPSDNQTDLWINGKKVKNLIEARSGYRGGRGARLWELDSNIIKYGAENIVCIRIFDPRGAGGIHRRPVRFEVDGQNTGMLFPYEFVKSKFNPYYFWSW